MTAKPADNKAAAHGRAVDLPPILSAADISGAMAAVLGAAARGRITAGEAFALSQTIETYLRAIDATDFEQRLRKLEKRGPPHPHNTADHA